MLVYTLAQAELFASSLMKGHLIFDVALYARAYSQRHVCMLIDAAGYKFVASSLWVPQDNWFRLLFIQYFFVTLGCQYILGIYGNVRQIAFSLCLSFLNQALTAKIKEDQLNNSQMIASILWNSKENYLRLHLKFLQSH